MKTLKNQTLLYDDDCPLCKVYTSGFIKSGMLDENGKKPYCQLSSEEESFIDVKRASNEIALVDNENKTVIYGIDSLLTVLGFSFPWMQKIGNITPVKYFLKKLYSFISYNRKVIIPGKINKNIKLQCIPEFSFKYRILFIIFIVLTSSYIFHHFKNQFSVLEIFFSQIFVLILQGFLLFKFFKEIILNYLGNFAVSIFCGSLLLIPFLFIKSIFEIPIIIQNLYIIAISIFVLIDIYRRILIIKYNF